MLKKTGNILLLCSAIVFAGELTFTASVNRTTVGLNEPLHLTVTVAGENIGSVPDPELPDLPDFEVGSRSSSQSTNIQFINGKISQQQTITYIYALYPKKVGEALIDACTIEYKGETYRTQAIKVTVVKGSAPAPSPTGPSVTEPGVPIDENLKVVASVNRYTVYVGEQVNAEFALYTRLRLNDAGITELPTYSGFWAETTYELKQWEFQSTTINGITYNACVLRKVALFPMSSGTLKISPMKLDVAIYQPPRDFFDMFGTSKIVPIASNPITITVKPLPRGKPREFTGGVGEFSVASSLDRDTSYAAEPMYFTIRISGSGNLRLIEKPPLPPIPGVKVLDPEVKDNINTSGAKVSGSKEFRYPIIPQVDGEHIIPSIKIAYFSPKDRTYHLIETDRRSFVAVNTASAVQAVQTDGLKVLGSDIQYIKAPRKQLISQTAYTGWWLIIFYILGAAMVAASIIYKNHQARMLTDRAYARKLRASREVRKHIKEADKLLRQKKIPEFLDTISRVLLGFIGDRYNIDTGRFTKEQLIQTLKQQKVEDETLIKIDKILHQCDVIRYSPNSTCDDPDNILVRVKEIIRDL